MTRYILVFLVLLSSPVFAAIALLPHVGTNADLLAAKSTAYPIIVRDGFTTAGDVSPLSYKASNVACSLNAGNGDNGSQVKSADSKCWLASFPSDPIDIREWGAKCDGTTDDSAALIAADAATGFGSLGVLKTCRLSNNVTLVHSLYIGPQGALSVDVAKTLTIASVASDASSPFPGAGTVTSGTANSSVLNLKSISLNGGSDPTNWVEVYIPPSTSMAQIAAIAKPVSAIGNIGVLGAARTSDFGGSVINSYGLAGIAINDHATQADIGWAQLLIAVRKTAAVGATLGSEVNATNAVNNIVDVAPFTMFPALGITAGVWIAPSPCSFPAGSGICASPTFNTSTALGIVGNGAVLKTVTSHGTTTLDGIASTTTIVVNGPVNGECIPAGTTVSSKAANSVVISNAATCSTTETVNFSSVHRKGIVFDGWSLDPSTSGVGTIGVAMEMARKQVIRWVDDSNNPLLTMFSDATGVLKLNGSAVNLTMTNAADAAERITLDSGTSAGQLTYIRYQDRGLPWWDVGKNAGNEFAITNVQTGLVDLKFTTGDVLTLPTLGTIAAGTGKRFLCIDTATKIVYEGSGVSCN